MTFSSTPPPPASRPCPVPECKVWIPVKGTERMCAAHWNRLTASRREEIEDCAAVRNWAAYRANIVSACAEIAAADQARAKKQAAPKLQQATLF